MKKVCSLILIICIIFSSFTFVSADENGATKKKVIINEIMASNDAFMSDAFAEYSDWVELYNCTDSDIDLSGYYMSDGKKNLTQYVFPQGALIPANGYIVVWCSDKNTYYEFEYHTNFKVSEGETVYLTDKDGITVIDSLKVKNTMNDESIGRIDVNTDETAVFVEPSPFKTNLNCKRKILKPEFSNKAGFYTEGFYLSLSAQNEGALIYYTLDGSEPDETSFLYTAPIYIDSRVGDPNIISEIPTNNLDTNRAWVKPNGEVFKSTVIRAVAILNNEKSSIATSTYFVDKDIFNRYGVNVASIATNVDNLFDYSKGIYVAGADNNYQKEGRVWEREASFEYFDKNGKLELSQNIGIRIHGAFSTQFPQKSLRLYARSDYGAKKFEYKFFDNNKIKEFNSLILRNSGNDFGNLMFLDAMYQQLWKENKHTIIQDMKPTVMFINGEYWGIANLREHYTEEYFQSYYGGDENKYIIAENGGLTIDTGLATDNQTFKNIANFAESNDMNISENYDYVEKWIDLDNMAAYFVAEIFGANNDWPGNNVGLFRYNVEPLPDGSNGLDGRWRFFLKDLDQAYGYRIINYDVVKPIKELNSDSNYPVKLFMSMLKSEKFKNKFLVAFCDAINTNLSKENIYSTVNYYKEIYRELIDEHMDRWGSPKGFAQWETLVDKYKTFGNRRYLFVENQLKELVEGFNGLDSTLKLCVNSKFGKIVINDTEIKDFNDGHYNYNQTTLNMWNGKYFENANVTLTAVPNEGYKFVGWDIDSNSTDDKINISLKKGENTFFAKFEPVN